MDLGLLQKDGAEIVGTSIDCITFWENGRSQPQIHFFPKIISFLGYYPFEEVDSLSGRVTKYRYMHGLTYKELGRSIRVDGSTIASWVAEKTVPNKRMIHQVTDIFLN